MITLDRINPEIIDKIVKHKNFGEQVKEWKELGIVDENFNVENSPFSKGWQTEGLTGYLRSPYQEYVFMKDEKMLKALEIDYEKDKAKVDLSKLYPMRYSKLSHGVDIAKTLSNLTGKWIKKISDGEVEFEDGTVINTKDLDYKLIKPLIWWE